MTNILVIVPPKLDACTYYRLAVPYKGMATIIEATPKLSKSVVNKQEVVVFHSSLFSYELAEIIRANGGKVIVDFDDMWELPHYHLLHKYYNDAQIGKRYADISKYVDLITVSTEPLKMFVEKFTDKPIYVNPNTVGVGIDRVNSGDKSIIISGGITHINRDYNIIRNIGNKSNITYFYKEFSKVLGKGTVRNFVPVTEWLNTYTDFSISLATLHNDMFNTCKSNLRFLEAAATNTLFICNDCYSYSEVVDDETGYIIESKRELIELLNLIDEDDILRVTSNARKYVETKYNITDIRNKLLNKIESICK